MATKMMHVYQQLSVVRIEKAREADDHYKESDSRQVMLRDMLTDLRHYADAYGVDFYQALDGSYQVYLEERNDMKEEEDHGS